MLDPRLSSCGTIEALYIITRLHMLAVDTLVGQNLLLKYKAVNNAETVLLPIDCEKVLSSVRYFNHYCIPNKIRIEC